MAWHLIVWTWLAQAALCGSVVLLLGCLAARACRQPVRRLRVIELTLLGCLLVPWLSRLSFVPHWSIGLLGSAPEAEETPLGIVPAGRDVGEGVRPLPNSFPEPIAVALPTAPAPDPEPPSPVVAARPFSRPPLTLLLVGAYALATALVAVRWCVGLVRLRLLLRSAQSVATHVQELFLQVSGPSGRRVRLLRSDRIDLPLTCGLFRPIILLPEVLGQGDDPAGLRYVLAHEWSHVQRLDLCRWYLAGLAGLLFF